MARSGESAGRSGGGTGAGAGRANAVCDGGAGAGAARTGTGFGGGTGAGAGRAGAGAYGFFARPAPGIRRLAREAAASRKSAALLAARLERLALDLEKAQLKEYVELMRRPRALIWRNLLAGVARGVGIAIGFTFFAATIVWFLQALGALNLPIVGDYIADIVRIVQRQLESPY